MIKLFGVSIPLVFPGGTSNIEAGRDWLCNCPIHTGVTRLQNEDDIEVLKAAYHYEAKGRNNMFFLKHILAKIKYLKKQTVKDKLRE